MSEASSMRTSGSLRSPFPHPRLAKSRTYIRSAPPAITQFRRADLPRQSRNTVNARKTGMPSQTAARVETMRLTESAINRLSTHAMHARVSADQTTQASAPADATNVATSGESDRTSFIVFSSASSKNQMQRREPQRDLATLGGQTRACLWVLGLSRLPLRQSKKLLPQPFPHLRQLSLEAN